MGKEGWDGLNRAVEWIDVARRVGEVVFHSIFRMVSDNGYRSDHSRGASETLDADLYDHPFPQPNGTVWTPDWAKQVRSERQEV